MSDRILKHLKESWSLMNEFMKVLPYKKGSPFGKETFTFDVSEKTYVAGADDTHYKGMVGLDVYFGIMKKDKDEFGSSYYYIDYDINVNDVDATDIVTTVLDITFNVANDIMPEEFFVSFNPTKDDDKQEGSETKRFKLYKRIAERLSKKYNYTIKDIIRMDADNLAFIIQK